MMIEIEGRAKNQTRAYLILTRKNLRLLTGGQAKELN